MKIIDLLNKIANGEELPKEIKYNNINYYWCNQCKIYERIEDGRKDLYNDIDNLNDEVEILEEEKKIPEKISLEIDKFEDSYYDTALIKVASKIDELIDYLQYLKSKGE